MDVKGAGLWDHVERALVWFGRTVWLGRHPESEPHVWTVEETEAAWAKDEIPPPWFPNTKLGRFDRRFTRFTKWWSYLAGIGLLTIVIVLVADVVGTRFFKHPFPSATDFVKHMNVVAVFFAVAYLQTDRGSMAIEMFLKRFPPRVKLVLRTFTWLLGMSVCFYCAYQGIHLVDRHLEHVTRSDPPMSFLIWPFTAAMVIGFILLGISFVVTGVRDVIEFRERRARYGVRPGKGEGPDATSAESEKSSGR